MPHTARSSAQECEYATSSLVETVQEFARIGRGRKPDAGERETFRVGLERAAALLARHGWTVEGGKVRETWAERAKGRWVPTDRAWPWCHGIKGAVVRIEAGRTLLVVPHDSGDGWTVEVDGSVAATLPSRADAQEYALRLTRRGRK
jgi:hypothetical protein